MLRWLYRILIGNCNHKWEMLNAGSNVHVRRNSRKYDAVDYHLKCIKCGELKHYRLKGQLK